MNYKRIQLDITPYVRAPLSGIGRTAICTFRALVGTTNAPIEPVCRDNKNSQGFAKPRRLVYSPALYHSFEHRLPRMLGIRRVVTIHDLWTLEPNPYQAVFYQQRQSMLLRQAIKRADAIVTPSESVRTQFCLRFPELSDRVTVVAHGWQIDPSGPVEPLSPQFARFLSDPSPFLFSLACLEVRKNQSILLDALEHSHIRLCLVGHLGFGGQALIERIRRHKNAHSIVHVPTASETEVRALYQNCFAYTQPSFAEGFGMPVLDAMHFGKPLILSDIPVFREIAGNHAHFFQPYDAMDFLRAFEGVRPHNNPHLACNAARQTWAKAARKLSTIYENLSPSRQYFFLPRVSRT